MRKALSHLWHESTSNLLGRLVLLSLLVGVVAGLGAVVFNFFLKWAEQWFVVGLGGYTMPQPGGEGVGVLPAAPAHRWLLLLAPAIGGLLSGFLVYTFAPEAEGHGTDAVVDAFHRRQGRIRGRVPLIKTIASALTIGSGGSAGREGPIAQIGAGFASALAQLVKGTDRERRLLVLAGAGAGIGAVFRAPLGGALFATEVLYRDIAFESSALVPSFVASIVAYSIYCGVNGKWGAIFTVPRLQFNHPLELPLYLGLGIVCALMGILYVKVFYGVRDVVFRPLPVPRHFKPALGGLAVGVIGFFLPEVMGMGYGWLQLTLDGTLPLRLIVAIAFVKILATGLTISSGGSGGVFAPSVVIGGLVGGAVGMVLHDLMPGVVRQPATFALVGMAGFFAGVAKAPVSSLIMVSEMTTGYGLLTPLMLTTAVGYLLTPKKISIYEKQVDTRVDSPANEGEFLVDMLERIQVKEALPGDAKLVVFRRATPLAEILEAVASSTQHCFPVLGDDERMVGVIYFDDIRIFFTERGLPARAVVAQDLLAPEVTVVGLDEDLSSALRKFRTTMRDELPVMADGNSQRVIGVLSRHHVLATYHDRVIKQQRKSTAT